MREVLFRCSSIGKLMTEPTAAAKKAGEVLSVGAKTYIRTLVAQEIFSVDFEIGSKQIEKGKLVEGDGIALLNRVRGLALEKNTERRKDGFITGECDLYDVQRRRGHDLKCPWSVATFPITPGDCEDSLYEWQCRGYMRLWDCDSWEVNYALVDTPEHLIGFDPVTMHFVSHIPEHLRLTTWTVHRDAALERAMDERIRAARDYYAQVLREFASSHPAPGAEPPPWEEPKAPVAPVAAKPATAPAAIPASIFE